MFGLGDLKAPRLDGFLGSFFQKHWNWITKDIVQLVKKKFRNSFLPESINGTFIYLASKVTQPEAAI